MTNEFNKPESPLPRALRARHGEPLGTAKIIMRAQITPDRGRDAKARHFGGNQLQEGPSALQIVQFPESREYYLLYMDADGEEQNDTFHETLESALKQAAFEFGLGAEDWERIA